MISRNKNLRRRINIMIAIDVPEEVKTLVEKKIGKIFSYIILSIYGAFSLFPLLWMISTAFKAKTQAYRLPPEWIPNPFTIASFQRVLTEIPFLRFFLNSSFISVVIMVAQLVLSAFAAYGFARLRFKGCNLLFIILLSGLMVPQIVIMIPQYIMLNQFNWVNTYKGVIIPQIFSNVVGVFLIRQYLLGLPSSFEEAARIDGAGYVKTFILVIIPQIKPILITVCILSFMGSWNNLIWPLVVVNSFEKQVLSAGLATLQGQFVSDWTGIMAGATMTLLPLLLLYVFGQRYFVESIYLSGIK